MTEPWQLTNPAQTFTDILDSARPLAGDVVVAWVEIDSQRVCGFEVMRGAASTEEAASSDDGRYGMSGALADIARRLEPVRAQSRKRGRMPTGILVTLVCRDGRAVVSAEEYRWAMAWRYANHLTDAFNGDIVAMTPYGWASIEGGAGLQPTLSEQQRPVLRVVS